MRRQHTRIVQYPFAASLQGAWLDSYEAEQRGGQLQITMNIRALERKSSELFERDGVIHERIEGAYHPVQLRFSGVSDLKRSDFFTNLNRLPRDDSTRMIEDMLSWQQPERQDLFVLLGMRAPNLGSLMFFTRRATYEISSQELIPVTLERDWSPPPPMPGRLIPQPKSIHQRFGGDPITFHINDRPYHHRLFIGGLEVQGNERPHVDIVFNVSEQPSRRVKDNQTSSPDRWDNKGEGSEGMSLEVIHNEANWVSERLRKNQRILVHCAAGMNRSSTICCAVLIVLEGLTAEQALERVREHHPWARPDSGHWLKLRWLAKRIAQSP
jgi:Dual specificity phosphatase, catalytic domain